MEILTKHRKIETYEKKSLQKTKNIVAKVLEQDTKTRNNDTWLILQTLRKMGFKIYIDYHEIKDMPSFETITRSRRYWQNQEKKFLANEKTIQLRDKMQENYKETFI